MAQLIVRREKSMVGMAVYMNCYVNDKPLCRLKNGEEKVCDVFDDIIEFKCNLTNNPTSDIIRLDLTGRDFLQINVKQGIIAPQVNVFDQGAILEVVAPGNKISSQNNLFSPTKAVAGYFGINEKSRQWAVGKGIIPSLKNVVPYSYDDIIDFELLEDGTTVTKGGLGKAVVGGLLFGAAGAVVGGITGSKKANAKCTSLMVKITINNAASPIELIKLITTPTDKNSFAYKTAYQNAQEIISLLQYISRQGERTITSEPQKNITKETSSADEIRKFKSLLDDGIITEEEFNAKKRQLLGL